MPDLNNFEALKIGLASSEQIRGRSSGEVKKPETINYRTLKPEKDGLFCEKIFGPTKDWECYCGKYKRIRFKGIICERCGVEVTRSKVRRDRLGHIELAAPVTHIWYFKGAPSRMGYLLDISPKDLERVVYFASPIVTFVDKEKRQKDYDMFAEEIERDLAEIEAERREVKNEVSQRLEARLAEINKVAEETGKKPSQKDTRKAKDEAAKETAIIEDQANKRASIIKSAFETFKTMQPKQIITDEVVYNEMRDRYEGYFKSGMGAEAIRDLLAQVDLEKEAVELKTVIKESNGQKKLKATKRLKVVGAFLKSSNKPEWMILEAIAVIPPDLRPMVQLDGGRFATSDLNDLYRRVINRNNRLRRLLDLDAPEIIVNNEKRMLQEAVDALFDNGRRGRPVTGPGNRPLKSLSDMLKGKQGRFRQNLLGKRVDYSGRSVIVAGPTLKLHQCGLPKQMALELFKPFVMKRLVDLGHVQNIKAARRMVERARNIVWDVLEEAITGHTVMLNRAPTLHRLGIQAFEPILIEGKAIQIHPMVCSAFNADFDGDQMAVHLPLSPESQAESRILMLSVNNMLSPASGRPLTSPTQDMVIGCYYLTTSRDDYDEVKTVFYSDDEAVIAYETKEIPLQANIKVKRNNEIVDTTAGRIIFNRALPADYTFINKSVSKKELSDIVADCCEKYPNAETATMLDNLKSIGFNFATKAGLTIGVEDIAIPENKWEILDEPENEVERIEQQYRRGLITKDERHQRVVDIWQRATDDVSAAMEANFTPLNPIYMMANSGARGNLKQIRQLAGMRGLVANPKGDIIDRPIKANFREGLTVLEYFISTHGARKGLADTALRTADSGYLTRRLVDVAQDVIVREVDCGTEEGIVLPFRDEEGDINRSLLGRLSLGTVINPETNEVVLEKNSEITESVLRSMTDLDIKEIDVRSVLACDTRVGVCSHCYGHSLASARVVDIGEAVGIIAAQSIGEPGTQLTMRTFHTGGVAGEDITHGLPRIVELFEARKPKGQAVLAEVDGILTVEEGEKVRKLTLTGNDGKERTEQISRRTRLIVAPDKKGRLSVQAGQQLTHGSVNPYDILAIKGVRDTQLYVVKEVQEVYKSQGVEINDKHIEIIVRQMLKRVVVTEPGDTELLSGQLVDVQVFNEENERTVAAGGEPAQGSHSLLGITKASLATDSFLSAASFQETTRVLTDASISGKIDPLLGLKENVIIGKLIPSSTGMKKYRSIKLDFPGYVEEEYYPEEAAEEGDIGESGEAADVMGEMSDLEEVSVEL